MHIPTLKSRLSITAIARELGIEPNRSGKACCPFHDDRSPSFQISEEKQIATCFSPRCEAGTMDVIGLVQKIKGWTLPETLTWLSERAGMVDVVAPAEQIDYGDVFVQMQSSFLNSSVARKYAESRGLSWQQLGLGYNSWKQSRFPFLRGCVVFALKNEAGEVVSLYGRSVRTTGRTTGKPFGSAQGRHFYSANRKGLYPGYPAADTRWVILTESVIDAASVPAGDYAVLALYGTNGLSAEHQKALQALSTLQEVTLFFDGDEAGREAVKMQGEKLRSWLPEVRITWVETPEGEDINSLVAEVRSQSREVRLEGKAGPENPPAAVEQAMMRGTKGGEKRYSIADLLASRQDLFLSIETKNESSALAEPKQSPRLDSSDPLKLIYRSATASYLVRGGLRSGAESLRITLEIESPRGRKLRDRVELYQYKQVEQLAQAAADKLGLEADAVESDLNRLADQLEAYREADQIPKPTVAFSAEAERKALELLKQPNLLPRINELIGRWGVVGEEQSRMLLFLIASSFGMPSPLHALVQGSSGSGKTHLLASIMALMPEEATISLTRITESSLYNYGEYELSHKLIGIEDYDGLEEKAELAFRELQSKGQISSSTSGKNEQTGKITGYVRRVCGPIASLAATTKGQIYEDNMSRCFLIAVDESPEQTARIIDWQNRRSAGEIPAQDQIQTQLQHCIRLLRPYPVINPYATRIRLPEGAQKLRRLNELFQRLIAQITLLHQYQRDKDPAGRLIARLEDLELAIGVMFESIVLKVDELDGSLRHFYEQLKSWVEAKGRDYAFSRREVRQALGLSKTRQHRYFSELLELEYLRQSGHANRGYRYRIDHWDDNSRLRQQIKDGLQKQVENLLEARDETADAARDETGAKERISRKNGTPRNASGTPEIIDPERIRG